MAVDPQVTEMTVTVGTVLEGIGHTVTEASPAVDPDALVEASILGAVATGQAPRRPELSLLEAGSRQVLAETQACTALELMTMVSDRLRCWSSVVRWVIDHGR